MIVKTIGQKGLFMALFAILLSLPAISARAAVISNTHTTMTSSVSDPCTGETVNFTADVHALLKMTGFFCFSANSL